ncbi:uncharacterized protein [Leptinotarsa decemlineata]|uniref:uncharacterized protein n=1 Tax=Leptinotarsa decemlineata TaxID=7539 RepID=UPI003D30719D
MLMRFLNKASSRRRDGENQRVAQDENHEEPTEATEATSSSFSETPRTSSRTLSGTESEPIDIPPRGGRALLDYMERDRFREFIPKSKTPTPKEYNVIRDATAKELEERIKRQLGISKHEIQGPSQGLKKKEGIEPTF